MVDGRMLLDSSVGEDIGATCCSLPVMNERWHRESQTRRMKRVALVSGVDLVEGV